MPETSKPLMRRTALLGFAGALIPAFRATATEPPAADDLWGGIRTFAADLSADNQVTVTNSDGHGAARLVLDIRTRALSWDISYRGLTSPVRGVTLHGPAQPGTNGAAILDLGKRTLKSPITGKEPIGAGHVQYMLLGWTYVLISTARYPEGELRGKVDVVPPPELR